MDILPRFLYLQNNLEETEFLNILVPGKEIKMVIKNFIKNKNNSMAKGGLESHCKP